MKAMDVGVYRYPMESPADVSGLRQLIDSGEVKPQDIIALIAQTEGDGYARGYATLAYQELLSEKLGLSHDEVFDRIPMLMIGLTAGLMSPHAVVFTRKFVDANEDGQKRFVMGVKNTRVLLPEEYGTTVHVFEVANAVREAMQEANIEDVSDIHCVEVKCPNLTPARIDDALKRGKALLTSNIGAAGSRSKGASALGVALALGEITEEQVSNDAICSNWNLFSRVASTSAGTEQKAARVLVMGNSTRSVSKYRIASGVMKDSLDIQTAKEVFQSVGVPLEKTARGEDVQKLAAAFINAGVDAVPSIRGRRHTMHTDFLAGYAGIIAKAVINAVVGSLIGDTMILASAGWEHQGPKGASLLAVIANID